MKRSIGQSHSVGTAPRLLTIKQVADRLTVSVGCLHAWRRRLRAGEHTGGLLKRRVASPRSHLTAQAIVSVPEAGRVRHPRGGYPWIARWRRRASNTVRVAAVIA